MDYVNIFTPYNENCTLPEIPEDYVSAWEYSSIGHGWICHKCGCKNDNLSTLPDNPPNYYVGSNFCPNCGRAMTADGICILSDRLKLS